MKIERGDIWFADLIQSYDNVQHGCRPVVVCSNNKANYFSEVITVCPISTRSKRGLAVHVKIELLEETSYILCEQIMTINKKNLVRFKGKCTDEIMRKIDVAIDIQLQRKKKPVLELNLEKINSLVKSIQDLEQFIEKYQRLIDDLSEIETSLLLQKKELEEYCVLHGLDHKQYLGDGVRVNAG